MNIRQHIDGPDFVCIGAQKAGTTWLHRNLCGHSTVWLPPLKEIHFFNRICPNEELLGIEANMTYSRFELLQMFLRRPSVHRARWFRLFANDELSTQWYYDLFKDAPADAITGEFTPAYSTLDSRGIRYARKVLKPDCKILLILRNPLERVWSGIKMRLRWLGIDSGKVDLDSVIRELETPTVALRSDYARIIESWRAQFADTMNVFFYEDMVQDPVDFLSSVSDFIGVPVEVNHNSVGRRENADPRRTAIPSELYDILVSRYATMIEQVEMLVPGAREKWSL